MEREPELVRQDVWQGKVSLEAARDDYGVVLKASGRDDPLELDLRGTDALRSKLRASRGGLRMLDRGPGYERMVGGKR